MIIVISAAVFAAIAFLVIFADALANQRYEPPPMVRACPSHWIGFEGMCYYFSEEKRNWSFSQSFCSSQNASLLVFNLSLESKKFVMRYKGKAPFWIGLRRQPNQPWKWTNGENSALEVIGDGDCASLSNDTLSTVSCSTKLFWICGKVQEKCYVKT